jgi:hypothetical protein
MLSLSLFSVQLLRYIRSRGLGQRLLLRHCHVEEFDSSMFRPLDLADPINSTMGCGVLWSA